VLLTARPLLKEFTMIVCSDSALMKSLGCVDAPKNLVAKVLLAKIGIANMLVTCPDKILLWPVVPHDEHDLFERKTPRDPNAIT
jgi:hypothetical protein